MTLSVNVQDLVTSALFNATFTDAGTPNTIALAPGSVGPMAFTGEFSQSIIGPPNNILISSATTISNTGPDAIRITAALSGQNFVGPDNQVALTASGTWLNTVGSVMNMEWFNDPNNGLGAACLNALPACLPFSAPGNLVGSFTSPAAIDPTSSYAFNPGTGLLPIPDTGLFSMTELWTYTLLPGGSLVSRGQTELKSLNISEPGTLFMLGTGLIGFSLLRRRRAV
ncbi:MAG TPA: PEP-CTERM sorting domain-containing protein [Micropepsaceae bacterium]|nr:PEP-CTERM sorting domain-containing protein [Micropepsaceae bacterium]